jgi:ornithine cyclodeaminase/alanine dehydrogenase-like protein (mu-crystallin family)
VTVLVLSDADVRAVLDMPSCIEAMRDALVALERDEAQMPLRSIMRPGTKQVLGLMPAYRGGDRAVFSLKEIVVAPANAARGLDPHQGAVLLHDAETGRLRAILNASAVTEIRTAAVSAVATSLLARDESRVVAILGSGVQGRSHVEAMRAVLPDCELRIWSRTPERAVGLALQAHADAVATVAEALDGADVVCTCTSSREAIVERSWLAPGTHVNAVGSSIPSMRELDTRTVADASLFVDRRESTLAESGDFRIAADEVGLDDRHIRAELGELLVGAHPGRTRPDELTVFKSLGLAVEDLFAAELAVARARERGVGTEVDF